MPRATYTWEELCTVETFEAAADFVEVELCCSQVTHTDPYRQCLICHGVDHVKVERRLKYTSKTYKASGKCEVK
ncbi:hypothetical protein JG688_00016760 [Phytophthora aleatoria]|uniref:Uncharacterized protein n=1 Tax=Phytophthora aleatoria TaxID=2496075 RepID=A0A8J5IIH6_9STRA|nr:hypothetical protein JG688_00016760 [Phytophthora aleatoria]